VQSYTQPIENQTSPSFRAEDRSLAYRTRSTLSVSDRAARLDRISSPITACSFLDNRIDWSRHPWILLAHRRRCARRRTECRNRFAPRIRDAAGAVHAVLHLCGCFWVRSHWAAPRIRRGRIPRGSRYSPSISFTSCSLSIDRGDSASVSSVHSDPWWDSPASYRISHRTDSPEVSPDLFPLLQAEESISCVIPMRDGWSSNVNEIDSYQST
jgi:hypothetical protein